MNLPDIPLFGLLREQMSWLNQRQSVLSQNVANADVPGYVAQDLKPLDFSQALGNVAKSGPFSMAVTDPQHIALPTSSSAAFEDTAAPDTEAIAQGNSVSPEQEMIKVAGTQAQYQAATNIYAKSLQMMRTAIDRQGS